MRKLLEGKKKGRSNKMENICKKTWYKGRDVKLWVCFCVVKKCSIWSTVVSVKRKDDSFARKIFHGKYEVILKIDGFMNGNCALSRSHLKIIRLSFHSHILTLSTHTLSMYLFKLIFLLSINQPLAFLKYMYNATDLMRLLREKIWKW